MNRTDANEPVGNTTGGDCLNAVAAIAEHPYTLLSLSDREKFHTGFVALGINQFGREFANAFFPALDIEIGVKCEAIVESGSVDLTVKVNGAPRALVEMKFKSGMREEQAKKLRDKVGQHNGTKLFVVGLYEPAVDRSQLGSEYGFIDLVSAGIQAVTTVESQFTDGDPVRILFDLWRSYLYSLEEIRRHFESADLSSINGLRAALGGARITGIFEGERMRRVALEVEDALVKAGVDGLKATHYDNTHGNPLVEFGFGAIKGRTYGLQWQARSLKFFIEAADNRDRRDCRLSECAVRLDRMLREKSGTIRDRSLPSPTKGHFSSITMERWDPFESNVGRAALIVQMLSEIQGYRAEIEALWQS